MIPPCSIHGVTLTIRKFNSRHFTVEDLMRMGTLDPELSARLQCYVQTRQNVLISGGTATGKTTHLNSVGRFISGEDPILLIEDTSEIQLEKPNLTSCVLQSGIELPYRAIKSNIADSLNVVI